MHILVVNIPVEFKEADAKAMFAEFGTVTSAVIGEDKKTGTSAGYAIIEMPVKHEARDAVEALKGREFHGKVLLVKVLKPDDPFHNAMQPKGHGSGGAQFRREGFSRGGGGAIRRGGQRGG